MANVWIIAHYTQLPNETGNGRFHYLANKLSEKNTVEIFTSSFSHPQKKQRVYDNNISSKYKITLVNEPGYKKNVSISRIISHFIMSINLRKELNTRSRPDIIYCAVPSLSLAYTVSTYANKKKIPFIIDVQDLWPEAFKMIFNQKSIANIIFRPLEQLANSVYRRANSVVAVSDTYLERVRKINNTADFYETVYLGTLKKYYDFYDNIQKEQEKNIITIVYIGTLGHSYDIPRMIDAVERLINEGYKNIKFLIIGDGPLYEQYLNYSKKIQEYVEFTGRLGYEEMALRLKYCDIAVNPIKKGSAASVINKVADYAMAGLPVLNTQDSQEYMSLVDKYKLGFNTDYSKKMDIENKLRKLVDDKKLRIEFGENNRRLGMEIFDRDITYRRIVEVVEYYLNDERE